MIRFVLFFMLVFATSILQGQAPFITTWETTVSESKISIPVVPGLSYDYSIDWENDGTIDLTGITGAITHEYANPGLHQIAISGIFPGIYINDGAEKEKIVSIDQWGDIAWESMQSAFHGAENLIYQTKDVPDLSNVVQLSMMFSGAISLDADISYWDISTIEDMSGMLDGTIMSTTNYDKLLYRWSNQNVKTGVEIGVQELTFCVSQDSREKLQSQGWNFVGDESNCAAPRPFVTTWLTTSPNESITITTDTSYTYDYQIDWDNDGTIDVSNVTGDTMHTYLMAGEHQIAIYGNFPARGLDLSTTNPRKLINVDQWGDIEWESMASAFEGCRNMKSDAYDTPDLSKVSSISRIFYGCRLFNSDINLWDVSNVTDMSQTFRLAVIFNQDLNKWNVSNVNDMSSMFISALAFNGNISSWNVSNVMNMSSMFSSAYAFNQDIGTWDVSNVTGINLRFMFNGASAFNQDIGSWYIGNKTSLSGMFWRAESFNQDIGMWEVDSVMNMEYLFSGAVSFNQDISMWEVVSAHNMRFMFLDATSFDHDLGDWDITAVQAMLSMMDNSGLSQLNYDSTLIKWSSQAVYMGVEFGAGGLEYCYGSEAHLLLTTNNNWVILGDTESCDNAQPCATSQENIYEGPTTGSWNEPSNWSLLRIPDVCDEVVVKSGFTITLSDHGECYTLDISVGSNVEFEDYKLEVWGL